MLNNNGTSYSFKACDGTLGAPIDDQPLGTPFELHLGWLKTSYATELDNLIIEAAKQTIDSLKLCCESFSSWQERQPEDTQSCDGNVTAAWFVSPAYEHGRIRCPTHANASAASYWRTRLSALNQRRIFRSRLAAIKASLTTQREYDYVGMGPCADADGKAVSTLLNAKLLDAAECRQSCSQIVQCEGYSTLDNRKDAPASPCMISGTALTGNTAVCLLVDQKKICTPLVTADWTPHTNGGRASNLPIATIVTHSHLATASSVFSSLSEEEHGRVACFTKQDALPSALEKLDVLLRQMQGYAVLLGAERIGSRDVFSEYII